MPAWNLLNLQYILSQIQNFEKRKYYTPQKSFNSL